MWWQYVQSTQASITFQSLQYSGCILAIFGGGGRLKHGRAEDALKQHPWAAHTDELLTFGYLHGILPVGDRGEDGFGGEDEVCVCVCA